uniref:Uncharacterized protein n=1 Tax=Pristionchus pacificus TaxID=54126 RepID=A0A2A6BQS3_PRIPA|eukprot:PDM68269.1 hypothetical protein PRIPAC_46313 [Pristionchus pacificus]
MLDSTARGVRRARRVLRYNIYNGSSITYSSTTVSYRNPLVGGGVVIVSGYGGSISMEIPEANEMTRERTDRVLK